MRGKSAVVIICLLALCSALISAVSAAESIDLSELRDCRKIYSYSGKANAYFYGFSADTLYSVRVIPDRITRSVKPDGGIRAVCHDEEYAYALVKKGSDYSVIKMNINSGNWEQSPLDGSVKAPNGLAAAYGEIFTIQNNNSERYILGFYGGKQYRYSFSENAEAVFTNGNRAYAKLDSGKTYRLSKGSKTYAADLGVEREYKNAGNGWVYLDNGLLVSLEGSSDLHCEKPLAVFADGAATEFQSGIAAAFANGKTALLRYDYLCEVSSVAVEIATAEKADNKPDSQTKNGKTAETRSVTRSALDIQDGVIIGIPPGMTVSKFMKAYEGVNAVQNAYGNTITSGKMKTGYSVVTDSGTYKAAVTGDLNSNGAVNNSDVKYLMECFAGLRDFENAEKKAADTDKDGTLSNRDLLLLARSF